MSKLTEKKRKWYLDKRQQSLCLSPAYRCKSTHTHTHTDIQIQKHPHTCTYKYPHTIKSEKKKHECCSRCAAKHANMSKQNMSATNRRQNKTETNSPTMPKHMSKRTELLLVLPGSEKRWSTDEYGLSRLIKLTQLGLSRSHVSWPNLDTKCTTDTLLGLRPGVARPWADFAHICAGVSSASCSTEWVVRLAHVCWRLSRKSMLSSPK